MLAPSVLTMPAELLARSPEDHPDQRLEREGEELSRTGIEPPEALHRRPSGLLLCSATWRANAPSSSRSAVRRLSYNDARARRHLQRDPSTAQQILDVALAFAVINRHFDVADLLLEHGADINTNWNSHEPASILHHLLSGCRRWNARGSEEQNECAQRICLSTSY